MLTEFKYNKKKKKAPPSNIISGVFRGTTVLVGSVVEGVAGLVVQPVLGAKNRGVKGATIGVGKGILGLICKPIAGSIDMITHTVRGIGNTPGSIYFGAKKIFRRRIKGYKIPYEYPPIKPYIPSEANDRTNQVYIGEDEKGEIYVDKKELKKVLKKHKLCQYNKEESKHSEQAKRVDSGFEDDQFNSENLTIIAELVRKKQLKRIRQSQNSDDEYLTCRDETSYSQSSSIDHEDIEVFMVKPIEIMDHDDSSSIYDSDEDEEEDMYYSSNKKSQNSDDESNLSDSLADFNDSPSFKISTMGQINNKFERRQKKHKKRKNKKVKEALKRIGKDSPVDIATQKRKEKIEKMARSLKPVKRNDDFRISDAHPSGGFALLDQEIINKYRNVAKEVIKRVGSQILRGKINLTSVSFPIKCMAKMSHLEALASIMTVFPCYLTASAFQTDPVERMKWFLVAMISSITATHMFEKPLNPILGETYVCE